MGHLRFRSALWPVLWITLLLVLSALPTVGAWVTAGPDQVVTGASLNPLDGNSYLAKMREGYNGSWTYMLPYTAEPQQGAPILTFYLALGHLARIMGLSLPLVYHLARVLASAALLVALWGFCGRLFTDVRTRRVAFLFAATGSGLGWFAVGLGGLTPDLWVHEGYTIGSMLANPHFPLGVALMLLSLGTAIRPPTRHEWGRRGILLACGLGLSLVQPISLAILWLVLGVYAAWERTLRRGAWALGLLGASVLGGAPLLLVNLWYTRANPTLAAWSAQNVCLTPPPWLMAVGYGLVLIAAVAGAVRAARGGESTHRLLLTWAVLGSLALYIPFALQRRLVMGLQVPLGALAALAFAGRARRWAYPVVAASALTSVFVLLLATGWVGGADSRTRLSRDEAEAMGWLRTHTSPTDAVLSSPDLGSLIPAWAGNRVVYGHPFETLDAERKLEEVTQFFEAPPVPEVARTWLDAERVRYILIGPRERALGAGPDLALLGSTRAYEVGSVQIWSWSATP